MQKRSITLYESMFITFLISFQTIILSQMWGLMRVTPVLMGLSKGTAINLRLAWAIQGITGQDGLEYRVR